MRGNEKRPGPGLLDLIETKTKDLGATLGLIDDSIPPVGSAAYQKLRVSRLMDEDCISMRNEPIEPLDIDTGEDMAFDLSIDGDRGPARLNDEPWNATAHLS